MNLTAKKAHQRLALEGWRDLRRETDGKISTKALVAAGHPFGRGSDPQTNGAKKGQRKRLRPTPINRQSGQLRRKVYLRKRGGSYRLGSDAPYAAYQFDHNGTKKMIRRGVVGGRKRGGKMGLIERYFRARLKGVRDSWKKAGRA